MEGTPRQNVARIGLSGASFSYSLRISNIPVHHGRPYLPQSYHEPARPAEYPVIDTRSVRLFHIHTIKTEVHCEVTPIAAKVTSTLAQMSVTLMSGEATERLTTMHRLLSMTNDIFGLPPAIPLRQQQPRTLTPQVSRGVTMAATGSHWQRG